MITELKEPGIKHTCNPSGQEAEAGGLVSLKPAWATHESRAAWP